MTQRANRQLLRAVLEPRKPGAIQQIVDACNAGADPNGVCPATSTAAGRVHGGSTLLTHSVHQGASRAVKALLECGADPSLADANGWTPWMASTLVDESKRATIQTELARFEASKAGDHIGQLARALTSGRIDEITPLIRSPQDLTILSGFRVDLLRHQIINANAQVLELLLEHDMQPSSAHLTSAIKARNVAAADLLLHYGVPPEDPDEGETPLMMAASMGEMGIVQSLVAAGADVNRSAHDNVEWTPAFIAGQAGHTEIADWLASRMSTAALEAQQQLVDARNPKFRLLYEQATASEGLSTDDIVATLGRWDAQFGVSVREASTSSATITLASIPADVEQLLREFESLCPDAAEDMRAVRRALLERRELFLWWD